jgi:hypothetical protein
VCRSAMDGSGRGGWLRRSNGFMAFVGQGPRVSLA